MPKKKILVVTGLYPYPGNIYLGTFVTQQLQILKENFDITVLTVYPKSLRLMIKKPSFSRKENGLNIVSIPCYPFWIQGLGLLKVPTPVRTYINKITTRSRLYNVAKALHANEHFDIVHGHETYLGDEAGPIGKLLGIPSVFTLHSFYFYHKKIFGKPVARLALKNLKLCDQYISVSSIAADSYIKEGLDRNKFTIIPNGVNTPAKGLPNQKILNFSKGRKVLLSVGYLSKDKKFDISIRVLAQLPLQETVLVIVGIGTEKKKLQSLARSLHCEERILWLGAVEPSAMTEVYRASDILIHPSVIDSFSMVCLEAMSNKKVVICTNVIGICEFTKNGKEMLTIPPNDIKALLSAIQSVLYDSQKYNIISANALALAQTLTWKHQVQRIQRVYESAMDNKRTAVKK